jgi:hypothetical protein
MVGFGSFPDSISILHSGQVNIRHCVIFVGHTVDLMSSAKETFQNCMPLLVISLVELAQLFYKISASCMDRERTAAFNLNFPAECDEPPGRVYPPNQTTHTTDRISNEEHTHGEHIYRMMNEKKISLSGKSQEWWTREENPNNWMNREGEIHMTWMTGKEKSIVYEEQERQEGQMASLYGLTGGQVITPSISQWLQREQNIGVTRYW